MNTPQKAVRQAQARQPQTADDRITLRVKGLMGQHDLSRRGLAELSGINHVTLGRRLIGDQSWDIAMVERLAEVFDVDLTWLLAGIEIAPEPDYTPGGGTSSPLTGSNRRPLAYKVGSQPGATVSTLPLHRVDTDRADAA
ncbi:immunity repressor [Gordonia phage Hitter]|nr:immunity repressor [Gordonia phage Hitter]